MNFTPGPVNRMWQLGRSHIVVLEVIRRLPPERPDEIAATWPHADRGEAGGAVPEEPALYSGLGHHRPFG